MWNMSQAASEASVWAGLHWKSLATLVGGGCFNFGKPCICVNEDMCCFLGWQEIAQLEQCPPTSFIQTPVPPSFPAWCCPLGVATFLSTDMMVFLHDAEATPGMAWGEEVTAVLCSKAQPVAVLLSSVEVLMCAPHNLKKMSIQDVADCLDMVEVFRPYSVGDQRYSNWLPDIDLDITYLPESSFIVQTAQRSGLRPLDHGESDKALLATSR